MSLILPGGPQFSLFASSHTGNPTQSPGVAVSHPAGGANTKNTTWTELVASTAFDAQLVVVRVGAVASAGADTSTLLDIGIGAAAAETVIIPDLLVGGASSGGANFVTFMFPLYIPSGSRISARTQSVRTTGAATVIVDLYGGPLNPDRWWCGQQVTAYGINTADSGGTAVTAGNSGAETATPVAIGTTTADHGCIVFAAALTGTIVANLQYHYDVGIDVASTSWLAQDLFKFATTTNEVLYPNAGSWLPILAHVPSGSVLVSGGECNGTADALIDIALYGVS